MMKPMIATLSAAVLLASAAVAAERKTAPPGQARGTPSAAARPLDDTRYRHGETVRETAQRSPTGKPAEPPGDDVRQVARTQRDFGRLDSDRSGTLVRSELDADSDLALRFATFDTNADGRLSRSEYDAYVVAGLDDD